MAVDKIEDAPVMIVAACVLHNICLINDEDDIEDLMDNNNSNDDDHDNDNYNNGDAEDKRNQVMRNLPWLHMHLCGAKCSWHYNLPLNGSVWKLQTGDWL